MFNWLGNLFPYSDLHSLNLDWLLSKMKETATQAAQAIADSAKALAQVIEAKTAAQNAQTAAQNAQTAANNAADSAENAVTVAQAAKSAAQTAQSTAETAQSTAETAQSTAQTAQTAAQNAADAVTTLNNKFPIKTEDIADAAVTTAKIANNSINGNKVMDGSLYLSAFYKSKLYALALPVVAGSSGDKEYTGAALTFDYGSAENNRVTMAMFRFEIDSEIHAVSVPGANPSGYPLTYRRRFVRSNGQDLIISITVSNNTVTFNIDNYADSGLAPFHVYFHPMVISTAK